MRKDQDFLGPEELEKRKKRRREKALRELKRSRGERFRTFDPIGHCIYCGAASYCPEGGKLAKEHILPFALEGQLILPKASCRACEDVMKSFEDPLLNGLFYALRRKLAFSRRNRQRSETGFANIVALHGSVEERMSIPLQEHPAITPLPVPPRCRTLREPGDTQAVRTFVVRDYIAERRLVQKYGISGIRPPNYRVSDFYRMLSKIAHGYAIAKIGAEHIKPCLLDLIHGRNEDFEEFVGALSNQPRLRSSKLWQFQIDFIKRGDTVYAVVQFRFLGTFGGPIYEIVAGSVPNATVYEYDGLLEPGEIRMKIIKTS